MIKGYIINLVSIKCSQLEKEGRNKGKSEQKEGKRGKFVFVVIGWITGLGYPLMSQLNPSKLK